MLCLSVRQPNAFLICAGIQDIENRSWQPSYRGKPYRGPLLIQASRTLDRDFDDICDDVEDEFGITLPREFDLGGIVVQVELVDCVTKSDSPWFSGPYGLVLRNAKPLPFRECKGKLGLFEVS